MSRLLSTDNSASLGRVLVLGCFFAGIGCLIAGGISEYDKLLTAGVEIIVTGVIGKAVQKFAER